MFRVLIVDDTKSVHAFLKSLLAKCPEVETISVFDGQQAVALLQEQRNFDLILLDWEMPNLNGPAAFKEFVNLRLCIPTMMMTTKNEPEDIQQMLGMGVAEYLMKPFTLDILLEKINYVCGKNLAHAA